jgi:hypothetical protein
MASLDVKFNSEVFRKDHPMVIATNRQSAVLLPVRVKWKSGGYAAGTVLARNTTNGVYETYVDGTGSGIGTAACVLFEQLAAEDFDAQSAAGSTTAVGIFGGCTVYVDKLVGLDAAAKTDLGAREIVDATGVATLKF